MKLLRKLCSEQVQILLERMDDHWAEEFAIDGSKWEPMLPYGKAFEQFTRIEQRCIRKTAQEQTSRWKREKAYTGILERTMSTTKTRWEFDDERHGRTEAAKAQPAQLLTTAALRQQMEGTLNDVFAKEYARSQQQYREAEKLRNYMGNVQFELRGARSQEEMDMIIQKQHFLMEHERHTIEHQQYLKQHAPKGYF